jgi:hypothetical protein
VTDSAQEPNGWPENLPVRQVRVARPTDRLEAVTGLHRDGLGLAELFRFEDHGWAALTRTAFALRAE